MNLSKIKSILKKIFKLKYAVALVFALFGLDLARIFLIPDNRIQADCMLYRSPSEVVATGPFEIGTDWRRFAIPKHIRRLPGGEKFVIEVSSEIGNYTLDLPPLIPRDLLLEDALKRHSDGQLVYFSIRVFNEDGKSVRLSYGGFSSRGWEKPPIHEQYFSLGHYAWEKYFFAKEEKLTHIEIKASTPVTIQGIGWGIPGGCHWPDRTWADIPENKIYRFDQPSPATDELENRWERPVPEFESKPLEPGDLD